MSEHLRQQLVRSLPAIDKLLNTPPLLELEAQQVPRNALVMAAREVIDELRLQILSSAMPSEDEIRLERIAERARERALLLMSSSLRRVVNATGIILHTGLGRAVLPETARKAVELVASGHSNLELDLETGGRGSRDAHFSGLLAALCGAESAIAVNNNAAAVMLALNTLAAGREVIVSRGQLVEIGGSFRLPEIMARAGVRLVEVGTTNHTRLSDYEAAITDETALLLRVHTSNYRIVGFTSEVPLKDLVELGRRYDIPVMEDAGSGSLIDLTSFGLHGEPLIQDSIKAGASIVTFSGDKLLGGPQCGLIVGRREMVEAMARNPLARAIRIDKLTVAALETTLKLYLEPDKILQTIPALRAIKRSLGDITRATRRLRAGVRGIKSEKLHVQVLDGFSEVGGGSLPGKRLPTKLVAIMIDGMTALDLAKAFRQSDPPIIGRISDDKLLLDLRTVEDSELPDIVKAIKGILRS